MQTTDIILALDIGEARIGLAVASGAARLASPLGFLPNDASLVAALQQLIKERQVTQLVAGLPRGLDGQETSQTAYVRQFVERLQSQLVVPIALQDEAVTSQQAETELRARGKAYTKGDVDALSATYILEDYMQFQGEQ